MYVFTVLYRICLDYTECMIKLITTLYIVAGKTTFFTIQGCSSNYSLHCRKLVKKLISWLYQADDTTDSSTIQTL